MRPRPPIRCSAASVSSAAGSELWARWATRSVGSFPCEHEPIGQHVEHHPFRPTGRDEEDQRTPPSASVADRPRGRRSNRARLGPARSTRRRLRRRAGSDAITVYPKPDRRRRRSSKRLDPLSKHMFGLRSDHGVDEFAVAHEEQHRDAPGLVALRRPRRLVDVDLHDLQRVGELTRQLLQAPGRPSGTARTTVPTGRPAPGASCRPRRRSPGRRLRRATAGRRGTSRIVATPRPTSGTRFFAPHDGQATTFDPTSPRYGWPGRLDDRADRHVDMSRLIRHHATGLTGQ